MEWKEALPLLQDNHTGVAISITPKGRAQSTVVSTAVLDNKVGYASRPRTVKLKNIQRTGRAAITVSSSTPGATSPSKALRPSSLGKTRRRISSD
jgi:hypothetical protein